LRRQFQHLHQNRGAEAGKGPRQRQQMQPTPVEQPQASQRRGERGQQDRRNEHEVHRQQSGKWTFT